MKIKVPVPAEHPEALHVQLGSHLNIWISFGNTSAERGNDDEKQ